MALRYPNPGARAALPAPLVVLPLMLAAAGCGVLDRADEPQPVGHTVTQVSPDAQSERAATVRTTLLEENESLRALLDKTLAEKRDLTRSLSEADDRVHVLDTEGQALRESQQGLAEQLGAIQQELASVLARVAELERERRTLAEMFALEKRQRLAFEKELLEREIAGRSRIRGGP